MAERIDYTDKNWTPGQPIYVRPRDHYTGQQVIRPLLQLITTGSAEVWDDAASWPTPRERHDLTRGQHLARSEWGGDAA